MHIRSTVAVLASLLCFSPASAQTLEGIGGRAGLTLTGVSTVGPTYEGRTGFVASVFAEFTVSPDVSFLAELEYGLRGYDFVVRREGEEHRSTQRLDFISVPLFISLSTALTDQVAAYVMFGPRVDVLVSKDIQTPLPDVTDQLGAEIEPGVGGGLSAAGGLSLRGLIGSAVRVEARYVAGLSDLVNHDVLPEMRLQAVDLSVAIVF